MTSEKKIQVPWLPAPIWKDFPMTKGLGHHRTPVGIILAANEQLTCSIESESLNEVQVRLFNNDSDTEAKFVIESSFPGRAAIFNIESVSVPFLECEYLDELPGESRTVRIIYPSDSKVLPIYRYGGNEKDFFELWDSEDAEFAYVESDYFSLLIPSIDKEDVRELPNGNHLDDLIVFYNEILNIYNHLIGLSLEETGVNKNVRNRFFIKADKSGSGAAYYCDWCTAETSESIKAFWLNLSPTNWGALHELGHGHELKCLNDETLSVKEIWNNILVLFYQNIMFGNDMTVKCTKREEMNIVDALKSDVPVKDWGLFHKLSFLIHMFLKASQQSFTSFNQFIRQELNGHFHYASGTKFLEKLMHFFAIDYGIDVYPFMKLGKAVIEEEQLLEHYYALSSVAYPLSYLITNIEEINNIKSKLGLWFETSLVTPLDLRPTKLRNDFKIKIDHCSFDYLFGDILKLMDGTRTIIEKRILSEIIIFENIPIGVYKIFIAPNTLNTKLIYDDFYAIVHANKSNELLFSAKVMKAPSILHDKIKFFGLGGIHFASLSVDPLKHLLRFHVFSGDPHSYYKNEIYAHVKIKNIKEEIIFNKSLEGYKCAVGLYDIHVDGPLHIEIFHAETRTRLKTDNPVTDAIIDYESDTNYLIVNELGFQKRNTPNELLEKRVLNRIELMANKIRKKTCLHKRSCCHPKYNLLLAIEIFERLFRENCICPNLRNQYKDCMNAEHSIQLVDALVNLNKTPNLKISKNNYFCKVINNHTGKTVILSNDATSTSFSTIKFLGVSHKLVAKLCIDVLECAINFHVLDSNPHYRYQNETYIEITIRNKENKVIFSKTLEGKNVIKRDYKINFTDLFEIDIFHAEPPRLQCDSVAMEDIIEKKSSSNTLILAKEYFNVKYVYDIRHTNTGKKLSLLCGETAIPNSKLNFLGLSDKYVATLYIDTQKSLIHFNVISINPNPYFNDEAYFGVKIRNGKKELIFDKLIEGLHPVTEEFQIPFIQRVELEVFHAEPQRLTSNNLAMRNLIDRKSSINTFFISREISSEYYGYEVISVISDRSLAFPVERITAPVDFLKFQGISDKHVATLYLDFHNDRILFNVLLPRPHYRFEDEVYFGITINNENGEVIFSKDIIGVDGTQQNFTFSFADDIEIDVFHAEPSRLVSDNPDIEDMIDHRSIHNNFILKKILNFQKKRKSIKHKMNHSRKPVKRRRSI